MVFEALLDSSIKRLEGARDKVSLSATADDLETQWREVHEEFAVVLGGIRDQANSLSYRKAREVSDMLVGHLKATLTGVQAQTRS
jgi:hypothetical protein